MAKSSEFTRATRSKLWIFRAINIGLLFFPVFIYVVMALSNKDVPAYGKVSVVSTLLIAAILAVFNIFRQKKLRCPIFIVMIGLYVAFKEYLLPLIIILACTSTLDDLCFTPLIGYYRTKLISSKTIDEREEAKEVQ